MTTKQLHEASEAAGLIKAAGGYWHWPLPPRADRIWSANLFESHPAFLPAVAALLRDRCVREGLDIWIGIKSGSSKNLPPMAAEFDERLITSCMEALDLWGVKE